MTLAKLVELLGGEPAAAIGAKRNSAELRVGSVALDGALE